MDDMNLNIRQQPKEYKEKRQLAGQLKMRHLYSSIELLFLTTKFLLGKFQL